MSSPGLFELQVKHGTWHNEQFLMERNGTPSLKYVTFFFVFFFFFDISSLSRIGCWRLDKANQELV